MKRTTVETNATASGFQIAALVLLGTGALLVLAHGMLQAGMRLQEVTLHLPSP